MNPDPASLANLRDITTPPPVPWWPLAPGWWFLLTVLGLIAVLAAVRGWRRWRANAYRRAALQALRGAENAASIAEILKRAALVASPRAQVASLTGSAWVKWLAETGGQPVPVAASQALAVGVFAERECGDISELAAFAAEWIRSHKIGKRVGERS
ncbi:MAG: DUF4381 domain-containing protein [Planctomycetes bacterium]|nr:DUF4381 domain-containing protein [Planctomycetota bacterium]